MEDCSNDEDIVRDDPAKTLLHFILANPAAKYEPTVYSGYVVHAWNVYTQERKIKVLHSWRDPDTIFIDRTPFNGNERLTFLNTDGQLLHDPIPMTR